MSSSSNSLFGVPDSKFPKLSESDKGDSKTASHSAGLDPISIAYIRSYISEIEQESKKIHDKYKNKKRRNIGLISKKIEKNVEGGDVFENTSNSLATCVKALSVSDCKSVAKAIMEFKSPEVTRTKQRTVAMASAKIAALCQCYKEKAGDRNDLDAFYRHVAQVLEETFSELETFQKNKTEKASGLIKKYNEKLKPLCNEKRKRLPSLHIYEVSMTEDERQDYYARHHMNDLERASGAANSISAVPYAPSCYAYQLDLPKERIQREVAWINKTEVVGAESSSYRKPEEKPGVRWHSMYLILPREPNDLFKNGTNYGFSHHEKDTGCLIIVKDSVKNANEFLSRFPYRLDNCYHENVGWSWSVKFKNFNKITEEDVQKIQEARALAKKEEEKEKTPQSSASKKTAGR